MAAHKGVARAGTRVVCPATAFPRIFRSFFEDDLQLNENSRIPLVYGIVCSGLRERIVKDKPIFSIFNLYAAVRMIDARSVDAIPIESAYGNIPRFEFRCIHRAPASTRSIES